jgi:hypothetical protein
MCSLARCRNAQVSQDEKLSTKATVDEDRKHAVEASIVRVMKARKTMPHQQLVMEVSQQLMKLFKPDPKVIKNRIESLISREVPRCPHCACAFFCDAHASCHEFSHEFVVFHMAEHVAPVLRCQA